MITAAFIWNNGNINYDMKLVKPIIRLNGVELGDGSVLQVEVEFH